MPASSAAASPGLSAALHLAEAGVDTVLVEAAHPGFGASGRNHGQVVPGYSKHSPDEIVAKFGKERGEAMNQWVQDLGRARLRPDPPPWHRLRRDTEGLADAGA